MDPGHTYDAQRFLPTNLWNEIVRRYTLDFATRGLTAQTELHRLNFDARGYMLDDDQEELLQAANEPGRGNSLILEPHPLQCYLIYKNLRFSNLMQWRAKRAAKNDAFSLVLFLFW